MLSICIINSLTV